MQILPDFELQYIGQWPMVTWPKSYILDKVWWSQIHILCPNLLKFHMVVNSIGAYDHRKLQMIILKDVPNLAQKWPKNGSKMARDHFKWP